MPGSTAPGGPPGVSGKFLHVGDDRYLIKGVAYGTFAPDAAGYQFPASEQVAADFELMSQFGFNTVRTYTVPGRDVLDEAARHELRVFAGVPWSQHVAFLDDAKLTRAIRHDVVRQVRELARHPATLLVAVGNEIPPGVVRWHGTERIERFLRDLCDAAKSVAPEVLLTYVNYPPTEYLNLPFFDVCAFNLYLHRQAGLRSYLSHLQLVAGNRPLLLTETGADSVREGEEGQADLTTMQIRTAFEEGACGTVAFSWTDDWWRGGHAIDDWKFGLTDVARRPKLALLGVSREYAEAGFSDERRRGWPQVSVLVCAYNAAATLDECLVSLAALDYPDYEVIVVNDGSTDDSGAIARRYPYVTVIDTANCGLSAARNTALEHATGSIVAYTDADARVDPEWLTYLIQPFLRSDVVGAGGPNVVPADDPWLAQCVARSPGGPTHVLLDHQIAEHVPGCNMAYRREALEAIGGFDSTYRTAGDDVDVCWRLQARSQRIGFAPCALVWHHHRRTVRAYWRQQAGYGEAETRLMDHHPERFLDGHARWRGRIYSQLPFIKSVSRVRVNAGPWGTAAFPSVYSTHIPSLASLPHLIQWQLLTLLLAVGGGIGLLAQRDGLALSLLAAAAGGLATTAGRCLMYGWQTDIRGLPNIGRLPPAPSRVLYRLGIAALHFVQPIGRAWGRLRGRLSPPQTRRAGKVGANGARARVSRPIDIRRALSLIRGGRPRLDFWSERWVDRTEFLTELTSRLRTSGVGRTVDVHDGWQHDRDIAVAVGRWEWLDLRTLVEEHVRGRCLLRVAAHRRMTAIGLVKVAAWVGGVGFAFTLSSVLATSLGAAIGTAWLARTLYHLGRVDTGVRAVVEELAEEHGWMSMSRPEGDHAPRPIVRPAAASTHQLASRRQTPDAPSTDALDLQPYPDR